MNDEILKGILWRQFGASIDMLQHAIENCPEAHWESNQQFWYSAYHTLFFLDYYLTLEPKDFAPPAPFDLSEFEDRMPPRTYSKPELLTYLLFCRKKCKQLIGGLSDKSMQEYWTNESQTMHYPIVEILLYNMRHVQHHTGQLNLMLRQGINGAPDWVYEAEDPLQ